jgi:hypothetical protein
VAKCICIHVCYFDYLFYLVLFYDGEVIAYLAPPAD